MALKLCSLADVTLDLRATYDEAASGPAWEGVGYQGAWLTRSDHSAADMQFRVVYDPAAFGTYVSSGLPILETGPGLYYWGPAWIAPPDGAVMPTWSYDLGMPTFFKAFAIGGELTATLRFVTDVAGFGTAYCDGDVVDTFTPAYAAALEDLMSALWLQGGPWEGATETFHVSPVTATAWVADTLTGKVEVTDGAPSRSIAVGKNWTRWLAWIADGGEALKYAAARDLLCEGDYYAGYLDFPLRADEDGWLYGVPPLGWYILLRKFWDGAAQLSAVWNTVSGKIIVADCNLSVPNSVGHHLISRKLEEQLTFHPFPYEVRPTDAWSERYPMAESLALEYANLTCDNSRIEMVTAEATGGAQCHYMTSLKGQYATAQELSGDRNAPFGVAVDGHLYVIENTGGKAYFVARAGSSGYAALRTPVEIGVCDDWTAAALVYVDVTRMLYCGLPRAGVVDLYSSNDQGYTWTQQHEVADLSYPFLSADPKNVWLTGYRNSYVTPGDPLPLESMAGRAWVQKYEADSEALTARDALTSIGLSLEGRSAVIVRPGDWGLFAFVPRSYPMAGPDYGKPGIAEYRSDDTGQTWELNTVHVV